MTAHGEYKVLDFGLAKLVDADVPEAATATSPVTMAGTAVGTIAYMSPEQARGETLDERTDIFSFGAVLYEMATGKPAFQGKTSAVIFKAILDETPGGAVGSGIRFCLKGWMTSFPKRWKKIGTCVTSPPRNCALTCSG